MKILNLKEECTACGACASVCPKNCVQLTTDEEGFYCPEIDEAKGVGCGDCERFALGIFFGSRRLSRLHIMGFPPMPTFWAPVPPAGFLLLWRGKFCLRAAVSGGLLSAAKRFVRSILPPTVPRLRSCKKANISKATWVKPFLKYSPK